MAMDTEQRLMDAAEAYAKANRDLAVCEANHNLAAEGSDAHELRLLDRLAQPYRQAHMRAKAALLDAAVAYTEAL